MQKRTETVSAMMPTSGAAASGSHEYLAFCLGAEEYGIDIQKVQELRGIDAITRIANTPDFIKGVINLRGNIVPIVDMRVRLGAPTATYDQFTVVIVLNILGRVLGIVVDSVSDVIMLNDAQIKEAPRMSTALSTGFLAGVGTLEQRMLLLMDIDMLISSSEMGLFDQLAAA